MAAELVAGALLGVTFEKLFEKLGSFLSLNFFKGKKSIYGQLKELDLKLGRARRLLNDAEERQIRDWYVKEWLENLKDVIYRAQDLLEDMEDEARSKQERDQSGIGTSMRMKVKSFLSSLTQFDLAIQGEMAKILQDLNLLLNDRVARGLKEAAFKSTSEPSLSSVAPLVEEHQINGRDANKQEVLGLLLSDDTWGNKIGVLPIVGMGGLGKTTLAQLVYHDSSLNERGFQLKVWVTVSIEFDPVRIMRSILEQVNPGLTRYINKPLKLQRKLMKVLKGKKFFFVLDDVWDENYQNWSLLKQMFMFGDRESKIIVTTSSRKVAQIVASTRTIYELPQVSSKYCWQIFVNHAFDGDSNTDKKLQDIGKAIVEKCNGIPLAVKSLGDLLRHEKNPKKWESILQSHVWKWSKIHGKNILPSLWLSYRYLPDSCLKQCFAYCSMFPKNYEFQKQNIIKLWMAEGFLQPKEEEKRMEELGEEYFDVLMSRSLFQRSSQDKSKFVMHDLVHDLAMFVSGNFSFAYDDNNNSSKAFTSKTRHLSLNKPFNEDLKKSLSEAKHLRTFIRLEHSSSGEFVEELFTARRPLRVLSASREGNRWSLADSFSNLKHLRYLSLSNSDIKAIPSSICALYYLQTLLLSNCKYLTRLPTNMGRLINLRHLDTTGSPLEEMPPQMGDLKELQTLTDFVLGKSKSSNIKELGELQHLGGKLRVSGLQNVINACDVQEANLQYKKNLIELFLEWKGAIDARGEGEVFDALEPHTSGEGEVFDALKPHTSLKKLIVRGYGGSAFPNWVGDSSFSNIVSIDISDNKLCSSLPPLGQLPCLQELVIKDFHGVKTIDGKFYGMNSSITPFQLLETLMFCNMSNWRQWSFSGGVKKSGCFPHLKELRLDGCPNLIGSLPDSNTIENLKIKGCKKLEFSGSHRYASLRELEIVTSCDSLKSLPLDYFPSLEKLVLVKCGNFESLAFSKETDTALHHSLTHWRIEDCKNLRSLPEDMRMLLPSLSYLGIFESPEIESFPLGGLPSKLENLVILNCSKLVAQHKHWGLQGSLNSLRSLMIEGCDMVLDSFPEGLLPISLKCLILRKFPHLKNLDESAFQHLTSFEELELHHCDELQFLPEQVLLTLRYLYIHDCPFLERRYGGKGEDWHKISHIPTIHISDNTTQKEREKDRREDYSAWTNV